MQSDLPQRDFEQNDDHEPIDGEDEFEEEDLDGSDFKPPEWAFAISFFWPGAGLVYLRKPLLGLLNFAGVIALAAAVWIALPDAKREKVAPWIGLLLCTGSGVWAYSVANRVNRERETRSGESGQE